MVVYKIHNTINNKIYVGITRQSLGIRWSQHKHNAFHKKSNLPLYKAMRKYGIENFVITVVDNCDTIENLQVKESEWLKKYEEAGDITYNVKPGGELGGNGGANKGLKWTEEAKARHSIAMKKRNLTPWNKNTKGVMKANSGTFTKEKTAGNANPFFGKKHKEETKLAIKQKTKKRPIVCINTGIVYPSILEAKQTLNLDLGNLYKVLTGKNKTIKGFKFEYLNKENV